MADKIKNKEKIEKAPKAETLTDKQIEEIILNNAKELQEQQRELLKIQAKRQANKKLVKIGDISRVPEKLRYSPNAIYSVFVKKTGLTTVFNGLQAEANERYTEDYIITFDHIMMPEDEV